MLCAGFKINFATIVTNLLWFLLKFHLSHNAGQTNESELGNKAQNIRNGKPTMWLNLGSGADTYKKHLVIHEFGHALGLYHEHQRSDFWKHIGPYINTSVMKSDLRMSDAEFDKRYGKDNETKSATVTKYDPDSVMHYW